MKEVPCEKTYGHYFVCALSDPGCDICQKRIGGGPVQKSFPKNKFESIVPTSIKGIYEVYSGNQLYYYMPKDEIVLYGTLVSKSGVNITRDSLLKKMAQKMEKLPLENALKIGNGKKSLLNLWIPIVTIAVRPISSFPSAKM